MDARDRANLTELKTDLIKQRRNIEGCITGLYPRPDVNKPGYVAMAKSSERITMQLLALARST